MFIQVFCKAINSELADIENDAENNFLISQAKNNHHCKLCL